MSDNKQTIEPNPFKPFAGLCKFLAWWTDFQRHHCEGIESTWSASADHFVRFRFRKGLLFFSYTLDLKNPDISQALFAMQIGLLKLQHAHDAKPNESEMTDERRAKN